MDLKGVGITKVSAVYSYVRQASAISQNYYPERLGRLYIINAPWGFSGAFNIVKGWLDPVTVEKIHVLGSGYQKELLAQVPAENLPKIFGGTCDCPGGCALSDEGPWTEKEWARPAKWEKPKDEKAAIIDTEAVHDGAVSNGKAPAPTAEDEIQPVPALA